MKVRYLADADLNKEIVSGVLRRVTSVDFLTAQAAGLSGKRDLDVLALAAESGRIFVDTGTAIDELLMIWLASEAVEWNDRLEWLPL